MDNGITIAGVVIAIFIVVIARGCATKSIQMDINDFCKEKGFDYGKEEVRWTLIDCENFENTNESRFRFEEYRDNTRS